MTAYLDFHNIILMIYHQIWTEALYTLKTVDITLATLDKSIMSGEPEPVRFVGVNV